MTDCVMYVGFAKGQKVTPTLVCWHRGIPVSTTSIRESYPTPFREETPTISSPVWLSIYPCLHTSCRTRFRDRTEKAIQSPIVRMGCRPRERRRWSNNLHRRPSHSHSGESLQRIEKYKVPRERNRWLGRLVMGRCTVYQPDGRAGKGSSGAVDETHF